MDTGNNQPVLFLNLEAIAEVKVLTSGYQAEYGRASGMQITAVTKSGTNRFRGSVYDVRRDSDWNSNSWANIKNGNAEDRQQRGRLGLLDRRARSASPAAATSCSSSSARNGGRARRRAALNRFRFPTALERAGDFSQTRDNNGNVFNLIRDASTNLPCTADQHRAAASRTAASSAGFRQNALYQIGLNILKQYPMPNLDTARPRLQLRGPRAGDQDPQQPAGDPARLPADHAAAGDLQVRGREPAASKTFPGSIPGFNDVQTQNPIIATIRGHGELHPQRRRRSSRRRTAGFRTSSPAARRSTASAPPPSRWAQPSNKNNVGLGDLPMHLPGRPRHGPALLRVQDRSTKMNPPFLQNGTDPAAADVRVGQPRRQRAAEHQLSGVAEPQPDPRLLAQPDEGLGPAHAEDRLLQPPQLQGAEPRHRRPELRRARGDELRQQHQQPDRLAVRLRQRGAGHHQLLHRRCPGSWKAATSTTTARRTSRTTGR